MSGDGNVVPSSEDDPREIAEAAGLRYVHDSEPGISRRVRGRGFSYHEPEGRLVDPSVRERIEALAIPPAWTDVWISEDPNSHLLATGYDEEGRKQYRYHECWREVRDQQKFERLAGFGEPLVEVRRAVASDLDRRSLSVDHVVAGVVRLIDTHLLRVGNERYAADNETFGVTTLRSEHVRRSRSGIELRFEAKGGQQTRLAVDDPSVVRLIERCRALGGDQLFCAVVDGESVPVTSADVNDYLRRLAGSHITAKDFRTWGATAIATGVLGRQSASCASERSVDDELLEAVDAAAEALGNTRAVCRSCYVAPAILDTYSTGELEEDWRRSRSGRWRTRAETTATKALNR